MPLHELGSVPAALAWLARRGARALTTDSRQVAAAPASAFIAWPGYANDARQFVGAALRDGAVACILEADGVQPFNFARSERLAVMHGLKAQTGPLASGFFGRPSDRLTVLAVTGTNGKTSTTWWTAQALGALGRRCGVVGTLGIGEPPAAGQPTAAQAASSEPPAGRPPAGAEAPAGLAAPAARHASAGRAAAADAGAPTSIAGAAARTPSAGVRAETTIADAQAPMPIVATGLTTPDPVTLHAAFRRFADAGFAACAIEASSIGLAEHRLSGTHIDVALLTNVTQDHLDYHGSMADYWRAKAQLFSWPGLRAAVLNADDAHGAALAATLRQRAVDVWTYAVEPAAPAARPEQAVQATPAVQRAAPPTQPTQPARHLEQPTGPSSSVPAVASQHAVPPLLAAVPARLQARGVGYRDGGLCFEVRELDAAVAGAARGETVATVRSGLIGDYNVANLLAVIGGLRALDVPLAAAAAVCAVLTPVPGRLQRVALAGVDEVSADSAGAPASSAAAARMAPGAATAERDCALPKVVVDYAHTPDALEKALLALAPLAAARDGVLWCVFGCGGDRDAVKRPLMGALAQRLAQHAVVTSDNPRGEAPAAILADIVAGMAGGPAPQVIADRRAAIRHAVGQARPADVVLIAGKGHEDYQEVAGVRHPFDDAVEARAALALRHGAASVGAAASPAAAARVAGETAATVSGKAAADAPAPAAVAAGDAVAAGPTAGAALAADTARAAS